MSATELYNAAKTLPIEERIELFQRLNDDLINEGVDLDLTPGEAELIDRRLQEHLDNPDDVISMDELKAKLDAKYGK